MTINSYQFPHLRNDFGSISASLGPPKEAKNKGYEFPRRMKNGLQQRMQQPQARWRNCEAFRFLNFNDV